MKRREFLRKTAQLAFATTAVANLGRIEGVKAAVNEINQTDYDLVAIKGGEPEDMFEKGIAALGGMSAFVKQGQKVVIKPNIGWDAAPERAANTNPKLVKRVVEHCLKAGAKEVIVFDYTCDEWTKCYKNSGIEQAVKEAGGNIVTGNAEADYIPLKIPKGKSLKEAKMHKLISQSDVFINIPILKNHGGAKMSIAMKNLMGAVWDRRWWHRNDLQQCIADFATVCKPHLNIVDCYRIMRENGPKGVSVADTAIVKSQIIGRDIVAVDAAAVKIFGSEPDTIDHIKFGHQMGIGTMELNSLKIKKISV